MFPFGLAMAAVDSGVQHGKVLLSQNPTGIPQTTTFIFLSNRAPCFILKDVAPRKLAIGRRLYATLVMLTIEVPFWLAVTTIPCENR